MKPPLNASLNPEDINIFSGFFLGIKETSGNCLIDIDLGLDFWLEKDFKIIGQTDAIALESLYGLLKPDDPVIFELVRKGTIALWSFDDDGKLFDVGLQLGFDSSGEEKELNEGESEEAIRDRLFHYPAKVAYSYDADTSIIDIDLGFGCKVLSQKIRYYGIDAPELRGEERKEGLDSKKALLELMPNGSRMVFQAVPASDRRLDIERADKDKFGRWLGILWASTPEGMVNVNDWLFKNGYAEKYIC